MSSSVAGTYSVSQIPVTFLIKRNCDTAAPVVTHELLAGSIDAVCGPCNEGALHALGVIVDALWGGGGHDLICD